MAFCRGGGEKINAYRFFSWKTLMKEAAWNRQEDNIKLDLEIGWEDLDWIYLVQDRDQWWALVNKVMILQVP